MNPILQDKLQKLKNASDYECWYLVKQPTAFDSLCYLVSFLEKYQSATQNKNIQDFISDQLDELSKAKPHLNISNNYRALRVAAFFGLITMKSSKYDESIITDTFKEITSRCDGEYEKTELYKDIIQRQIEKMFISSEIDEQRDSVRQNYRLYPVMLLYKILIELGRTTGKYEISMTEYRYLVATTEVFEDFLETLLLIKLLRNESEKTTGEFEQYKSKFDNRLILALKQLDTLEFDRDSICIKEDRIQEVAKKVFTFEENPNVFTTSNYLAFLGSTKSLFELDSFENDSDDKLTEIAPDLNVIDESLRVTTGENILLYGVPGSGKSWTIQHEYCDDEKCMERLVFHPDYMYSDFVGQILPVVKKDNEGKEKVRYEFKAGPFTKILKRAYNDPQKSYYLVIEEINRGNAPAIFGEIFQLLDRMDEDKDGFKKGTSEYGITNENIALEVYGDPDIKVRIPANLSILGTMNTSDQNVFTLDTAFQRRWIMRMIKNSFVKHKYANNPILDTSVSWKQFCEAINEEILRRNNVTSSEDKRLGAYFVSADDLVYVKTQDGVSEKQIIDAEHKNARFAEKVIKYLWDDAFKFSHPDTFDTRRYKSLEMVIDAFNTSTGDERFKVYHENLRKLILEGVDENNSVSEEDNE
mgnify:CR=1 FL=1